MKRSIRFIELPNGFMFIKVMTQQSSYRFWLIPSQAELKLYYDISAKSKSKGKIELKTSMGASE